MDTIAADARARLHAEILHAPVALSEIWERAWERLVERVGAHFSRADVKVHVGAYLKGLLSPVERKNTWQMAEAVAEQTPYAFQHLLGRARWDADEVRDDLRGYVCEQLGDPRGVLVIDETGFVKKGEHSAGVQRQYSGTAGRVENCQIGVFLTYATPRGRTFLDRELYLPASWIQDPERCEGAGIPADVAFATKPELALQMLERALDAGVPSAWVTADEVYGDDVKLRRWLEGRRKPYVLAVSCDHRIWQDMQQIEVREALKQLPDDAWQRISAGDGAKGPRWYDWAFMHVGDADSQGWQRGILFRRSLTDSTEVAYYQVFALKDASLHALVHTAGARWTIEESFESGKGEVGLDQYEVRSWTGWYRHITLALWAHAFLTVQRAASDDSTVRKKRSATARGRADSVDRPGGSPPALVAAVARTADP